MHQWFMLEYFEPNIHHIGVVENIVCDTLSRFMPTSVDQYEPSTSGSLSWANHLFKTRAVKGINYGFFLDVAIVKKRQKNN